MFIHLLSFFGRLTHPIRPLFASVGSCHLAYTVCGTAGAPAPAATCVTCPQRGAGGRPKMACPTTPLATSDTPTRENAFVQSIISAHTLA